MREGGDAMELLGFVAITRMTEASSSLEVHSWPWRLYQAGLWMILTNLC